MPSFGRRSQSNLDECHPALQAVMAEVVKTFDISVIEGHRPREEQEAAVHAGKSKVHWPNSKHNSTPSMAVDVIPWPFGLKGWEDRARFTFMAGFILGTAEAMGVKLRWGGDWDGDRTWTDQTFHDLPHFEIVDAGPYSIAT